MSTFDGAAVLDEYPQARSVRPRGVGQKQLESEAPITTCEYQHNQCQSFFFTTYSGILLTIYFDQETQLAKKEFIYAYIKPFYLF